ncbi:MAG: ATP-dependent zinc metalloprotease FtsH [Bacteroidales bacterium]|nr:ATP-dependent zinc metalloprotease FtsH [Bacteroidales bacterium]
MSDQNTNNGNNQQNPQGQPPKKSGKNVMLYIIYGVVILGLGFLLFPTDKSSASKELTWEEFEPILLNHDYEKIVVVNQEFAEIYIKDDLVETKYKDLKGNAPILGKAKVENSFYKYNIGNLEHFDKELSGIEEKLGGVHISYQIEKRKNAWRDILMLFGPLLMLILFFYIMTRVTSRQMGGGGSIFGVGRSKAKMYDGKTLKTNVTFKDVAGLAGAKEEVVEVVDFLKNPKRYTDLGGKIPKGVLLVGPPGTGKTLLAKAVAGEANVPFFSMSGSDFVEMFVGVGASRVRDLFEEAKKKAPCIIFIDEIDAVGRARGHSGMSNANDERENTLNQLLTEMDGFSSGTNVIVLAATNRADVLDKALLRAGRFDRQIYVELPDIEERKAIFEVHMKGLKLSNDKEKEGYVDREFLAKQTPGFSGADIANVCNEAALCAARKNKKIIEKQDFLDAVDRIVGGLEKRTKVLTENEKRTIAYHESGHASVSWLSRWASPLVKVTIVPRGRALGAAWYLPEERQITTYEQMFDELTSLMAGRAAEEVAFGKISTGALNDMERATKMAQSMVVYYGMSPELGNISYYDASGQNDYGFTKPFSEKTAEKIDAEVRRIVEEAYSTAKRLIIEHREQLDQLAGQLFEKEVLFREDLERIYGKRPWEEEPKQIENPEPSEITESTEPSENSGDSDKYEHSEPSGNSEMSGNTEPSENNSTPQQ